MATNNNALEGIGLGIGQFPALTTPLSPGVLAGIVGLCDSFCVVLCGLVVHRFNSSEFAIDFAQVMACLALFVMMAILSLHAAGLYRFTAIIAPARYMSRIVLIFFGLFLILTSIAFALKISEEFSRGGTFTWLLSSIGLVLAGRAMYAHASVHLRGRGGWVDGSLSTVPTTRRAS